MHHLKLSIIGLCTLAFYLTPQDACGQDKNLNQDAQQELVDDPQQKGVHAQFGTTRFRPPKPVIGLLLSPDEKYVVTISDSISIWDAELGHEIRKLDQTEIPVRNTNSSYGNRPLAFSQVTGRLIGLGRPGMFAEYDIAKDEVQEIQSDSSLLQSMSSRGEGLVTLDISKDDRYLAVGTSRGIAVFSSEREQLWTLENTSLEPVGNNADDRLAFFGDSSMLRISPSQEVLAYTMSKQPKTLVMADLATGEEIRRISLGDRLVRMDFSPDGAAIAVTERDNSVRSYRVADGTKLWEYTAPLNNPYENYTSEIAFEPDGKRIAVCATDNRVYMLDSKSGNVVGHLVGHDWYPWALAFASNRKLLYSSGWDGKIRRWELNSFRELALTGAEYASSIISFSPSGKQVAVVYEKGRIAILSANGFAEQASFTTNEIECSALDFSEDDHWLAYGGATKTDVHVVVVDVRTNQETHHWQWPLGRDPHSIVESLRFSSDNKKLAVAVFRQGSAYLMSLDQPEKKEPLKHSQIYGLDFSADGKRLVTTGWDSRIRSWDSTDGKLLSEADVTLPNQNPNRRIDQRMYTIVAYPFGNFVATADMDSTVRVWQLSEKIELANSIPGVSFTFGAMDLSSDGVWLVTGSSSGNVKIWNALSGALALDVGKHNNHIHTVRIGKDIRQVCSGSSDGICRIWSTTRTTAGDPSTIDEWLEKLSDENEELGFQAIMRSLDHPEKALTQVKQEILRLDTENPSNLGIAARLVSLLGMLKTADSEAYLHELSKRDENDPLRLLAVPLIQAP